MTNYDEDDPIVNRTCLCGHHERFHEYVLMRDEFGREIEDYLCRFCDCKGYEP